MRSKKESYISNLNNSNDETDIEGTDSVEIVEPVATYTSVKLLGPIIPLSLKALNPTIISIKTINKIIPIICFLFNYFPSLSTLLVGISTLALPKPSDCSIELNTFISASVSTISVW